ncbi:MAG: hypothetical protein DWI21_10355 [Planctomycetota bacterium]|nr:MAG: hypothetical protein DWI21_10355 [Planctomycetota bacterium]
MFPRLKTRIVAANCRCPSPRRGIATIWVLASMPVILTLLVMLVDSGNLWVARAELKNALDSAALSAAKTWGEGGSTLQSRLDAQDAFNTNTILGTQYSLSTVEGSCVNGNPSPSATAEILLGRITDGGGGFSFNCDATANCAVPGVESFAVRTRKTISVPSVASSFLGLSINPYQITSQSFARYVCSNGPPQLVHVNTYTCACP